MLTHLAKSNINFQFITAISKILVLADVFMLTIVA